jgi:peptidoglycan/xylan/chitin deacetylase (PgdA/CDA1 family)
MYHAVVDDRSKVNDFIVTPEIFERDMQYLTQHGFTTVFPSEILDFVEYGKPLPPNPVLVTFDDGHCGVLHYVLPILERMNLKANINIEGSFTEKSTDEDAHNPMYSYLTWIEIRQLHDSGHFEIGNHTYNMHSPNGYRHGSKKNTGESAEAYKTALDGDVGKLQTILTEAIGKTPVTFAYPYGFVSLESVPILDSMGLKLLLTCYEKSNYVTIGDTLPLTLHRCNRPGGMSTQAYMDIVMKR